MYPSHKNILRLAEARIHRSAVLFRVCDFFVFGAFLEQTDSIAAESATK